MKIKHIVSTEQALWQDLSNEVIQSPPPSSLSLSLTGTKKQTVLGFGGCFNELGWEALQLADSHSREAFLDELFSPDEGNFNYGRVPIGANDFSLEWYSCDEVDGDYELTHFNINRDEQYTLPFIKEAQKRQKGLTLFASPWSPPTWMKTKKAYNYGRIRMEKKVLDAYAQYFVKFVQSYESHGIPVTQVHVQNEPMADQKFPSCLWSGNDMRDFIRDHLAPAFSQANLPTQIWLGTINGPFLDFMMPGGAPFSEYYDQFANTILSDSEALSAISGVGLQWGGKHVMEQITASYPDLHYMQTESECGDGENSWTHLEYIFNQMWFYFTKGVERYTYWNIALKDGGISTWGWRQNSLCTVNPLTGELKRQPEFYLMKHLSKFVQEGATCLETKGHFTGNTLAFENPDHSIVLFIGNSMETDRTFYATIKGQSFSASIKAHSINTITID